MLKRQKQKVEFTGGLEAARLRDWHIDLLTVLKPKQILFDYNTEEDYDPLVCAGRKLQEAGFSRGSHKLRAYVLIGWAKDTFEKAEKRLNDAWLARFLPMAMLWQNKDGYRDTEWAGFQRLWARPAIISKRVVLA